MGLATVKLATVNDIKQAWTFFRAQPPGYQKVLTFWVMSAKKDETRLRRLDALIKDSAEGKRISWM